MTEAEWYACADPKAMVEWLISQEAPAGRRPSDRKLRLLACACVRRAWHLLTPGVLEGTVGAAERLADAMYDGADAGELARVVGEAAAARWPTLEGGNDCVVARNECVHACARESLTYAVRAVLGAQHLIPVETKVALVRDVVGDPFRVPSGLFVVARRLGQVPWLARDALDLALAAYRERPAGACPDCKGVGKTHDAYPGGYSKCDACRGAGRAAADGALDPVRLSILADCLEESGCEVESLLGHLRGPGPHARGCWALDTILGRE